VAPAWHNATARSGGALLLYWWNPPDHALAKPARLPLFNQKKSCPFHPLFETEHQTKLMPAPITRVTGNTLPKQKCALQCSDGKPQWRALPR